MCDMTSMGEMSAARMTMAGGSPVLPAAVVVAAAVLDLRRDLTTSLTPRLRDLFFVAAMVVHPISHACALKDRCAS